MAKHNAPVSSIGHGKVSPEVAAQRRYRREILLAIGMYPLGYDTGSIIEGQNHTEKRLSETRFSTNYLTRKEFEADRDKVMDALDSGNNVPEDLIAKISETIKELNLQFGE